MTEVVRFDVGGRSAVLVDVADDDRALTRASRGDDGVLELDTGLAENRRADRQHASEGHLVRLSWAARRERGAAETAPP